MNDGAEKPHSVVILGGGSGGLAMLEMLMEEDLVSVDGIVDTDEMAPGLVAAREYGVSTFSEIELALLTVKPELAFNVTGSDVVQTKASQVLGVGGVIGGFEAKIILRIINNMRKAKEELHFQASRDLLTGLYNRRYMMDQLHQGVSLAIRYQHPLALVMIDLDHFKQVNDVYGHAAGDQVLVHMAEKLRERVRDADVPGRWGGEEFIVLLPHTSLEGAKKAADQWLCHLNSDPVQLEGGDVVSVTFSAGIAMLDGDEKVDVNDAVKRLLHVADGRMYMAKSQGRNRVIVEGSVPDDVLAGSG
ncbi:diguanylate cyclase (GGDEF) domain-containing protein [Mariprofundus aestuarium]|uniref:diguanylate cyclase n=1 Tax=Mariprofundus aestuarium TaxID=1921086 RepID=A0A2K8KZY9_MARES|nr:GGDEF domain-containing protein [Mariprofundus aestuarium]ATX80513.1 diguanylate cyclase (GGDEF) domain-containing protein [Mariprofundus aestuarium]